MLNYLWGAMMLVGIIYAVLNGTMQEVTEGALSGAKDAVTLCITMFGVMSFWTGLLEIAKESGLVKMLTEKLNGFVSFMFPELSGEEEAKAHISTNIVANILGLGWAATPAGLKAMTELSRISKTPGIATRSMCTFLILNISSLQLIPINMIAYRTQYGSVNPAAIVGPAILATLCSTIAGIAFCKLMGRWEYKT